MSSGSTPIRIIKEAQRMMEDPPAGVTATPHSEDIRYFDVCIAGPVSTPYEGGVFKLELFLPENYPHQPPKCRFLTKIYHPNIDRLGRICLDILKDKWTPALQIRTLLISIQALLSAPNPDDPLNNQAAELWRKNNTEALATAKSWTQKYAMNTNQPNLSFQ